MIERFRLGFANRTLGYRLPQKNRNAGAELRGQLERLGVFRASGHEHFNGSLVIPIFDEQGHVTEMYGRKVTPKLKAGTPLHLYLLGPHRGVWNIEAFQANREIILCEALIDALTFWCAGFRNVTAAYGVEGFTEDHWLVLERYGTERVYIAYDRDEAGDRAAEKLANDVAQEAALELLRDPRLMDRILEDFERAGVVGERVNKLVGYLGATSRKLDHPLAVIIQSSSAAGKSSLMDAVALMPEEELTQYSAMTGQSLFYMGD
jgi:DNA primase